MLPSRNCALGFIAIVLVACSSVSLNMPAVTESPTEMRLAGKLRWPLQFRPANAWQYQSGRPNSLNSVRDQCGIAALFAGSDRHRDLATGMRIYCGATAGFQIRKQHTV